MAEFISASTSPAEGGTSSSEDRTSSLWSLLPSFDPASDDPREYVDKVKFLHSICPPRDKPMLAPRLAMLMKGTAWAQMKALDASKLSDPEGGIKVLLGAISAWEEAEELQTYEKCERALFRVTQKADETTMSYVNRINVAFGDLSANTTVADLKAFILLRQSSLSAEDKRKVITLTGGEMSATKMEKAMRSLSTKILGSGPGSQSEAKKKVYPVNFVDDETNDEPINFTAEDDAYDEELVLQTLSEQGDEDALVIQDFEEQLIDLCQDNAELSLCFSAYSEARGRIRDKLKSRGFWPSKGKGKSKRKGKGKRGGQSLADRIANSNCRICGSRGHWKWECPKRSGGAAPSSGPGQSAEVNMALEVESGSWADELVTMPPNEDATKISLHDLLHAQDEDCRQVSNHHQIQLELHGILKQESLVNEEFICMAESKLQIPLVHRKSVTQLGTRLKNAMAHVCRTSGSREIETVLSAETGCPGIIDTGASKSVIGQRKVKKLLASLPARVRNRVQWGKSDTVFRFGNNGTLASVGALYIPFDDKWMRLEVVSGETPFLLSNAFLRATAADVMSSDSELMFRKHGLRVPLQVTPKGLFTVDLAEVLSLFAGHGLSKSMQWAETCEVVTHAVDTKVHDKIIDTTASTQQPAAAAAKVAQHQPERPALSHDLAVAHHGLLPDESSRCGTAIPRGCELGLCDASQVSDPSSSRNLNPTSVGGTVLSGGEACRGVFPQGVPLGSSLSSIHGEPQEPDLTMGSELPDVHQGYEGTCDASGKCDIAAADHASGQGSSRISDVHLGSRHPNQENFESSSRISRSDEYGEGRGQGAATAHPDCGASARAGQDQEPMNHQGGPASVSPASFQVKTVTESTPEDVKTDDLHQKEFDQVVFTIEENLEEMLALSQEVKKSLDKMPSPTNRSATKCKLDVLEIYCEPLSRLTSVAQSMGLKARRFSRSEGDLSTPEGVAALWKVIYDYSPRDIWMSPNCGPWGNFSRLNMCRSLATRDKILAAREAEQQHLSLCRDIYEYQVMNGRHFHMEQPQGSEVFELPIMEDIVQGTLCSEFDMCRVGKLKVPEGNSYLRKRTVVRTTSRELHECLDARYCTKRHNHRPIEGKIRYLGKSINLSEYAARYSCGFAKNVCWYLFRSRDSGELPLEMAELCIESDTTDVQEQMVLAGMVKRQRCDLRPRAPKRAAPSNEGTRELHHKSNEGKKLQDIFKKIESRAPRAGTVILQSGEQLFQDVQSLCSHFQVTAVEVCRGTDRFRLPKGSYDETEIPLRQTFIVHRETGNMERLGDPEKWLELPKTKRILKSKPAKLCLTVFGKPNNSPAVLPSQSSSSRPISVESPNLEINASGKRVFPSSSDDAEKRHRSQSSGRAEQESDQGPVLVEAGPVEGSPGVIGEEYELGYPPKGIAQHGPKFTALKREERDWIKRVHHRMGHPDPERFAKFLKDTHADPAVVAGALEFQCDACSESRQGYSLARPSAIHTNLGFNNVVGIDKATWTNDEGVAFSFLHMLDEGTLYHLGRMCGDDAESQYACFEDQWLSWAGPPQIVYLDPATEYTSSLWLNRMQEEDIKLKMTATDSHWQLGRVESHGRVIKRMLDRMNTEKPIKDTMAFARALRQAFNAKNTLSRVNGYTPEQAVLGISRRLPASVISSEGASSHLAAESDDVESDRFKRTLDLRCSARKAFIEADNCSSLRRALLRRSRPLKDPFEVGDWVLYWKKVGGNMRRERGRWHGPARVALVEGLKVVWLTHANRLIRASPEQLRPASLREWRAVQKSEESKGSIRDSLERSRHQGYIDLGEEVPGVEEVVSHDENLIDTASLPEPEQAPSVPSAGPPSIAEDLPVESLSGMNGSSPNVEPSVDPSNVPVPDSVPGELSEEEAFFGDCVECISGTGNYYWEIDVTPESFSGVQWDDDQMVHHTSDELILLATEMRKKRVEVKLKDLGEHDQRLFASAKGKEIGAWLHHKTVRKVSGGKIPEHALMRCRWILNWKSPTGEEAPNQLSTSGMRAKARLVVIGFEDPDIDTVHNDAPTLSKDGRMAVLQSVASHRWELISFDVSTAFLHGKGDGRTLGIHPPPELREALNMKPTDQCALDGGAYGRIDAPYLWFCEFRDELLKQGCTQCPLDPCVFGLYSTLPNGQMKCHGSLGIHVDDGIAGGDEVFHQMLRRVENRFKFGAFEKKEFKYTGINFRQWDDYSIEYDQISYIEKISPISIDKGRKLQPNAPVTPEERSSLRSLVGALQYAAVHSRPDLSAKVGELQSAVCKATVEELITANKVLHEAKSNKVSLMVLPINPKAVTYCAFSDASFLSNKQNSAHQGTLIFATTPELLQNKRAVVAPVAWTSKKVPRVVRSTLGAEAAALSNTVDRLLWIRILWAWMKNPKCQWQSPESLLQEENRSALVTDCKSAYDLLTRTAVPQCSEHRTTIECLLIRERLRENCLVRWVSSQAMLADCLTKSMDSQVLRECLRTGKYRLLDEDHVLKERLDRRQRINWIKNQKETEKVEPQTEATCNNSFASSPPLQDFWKWKSDSELVRVHQQPRFVTFTPIGISDCPVDIGKLSAHRVTSYGDGRVEKDFWVGTRACKTSDRPWTGTTTFFLEKWHEQSFWDHRSL